MESIFEIKDIDNILLKHIDNYFYDIEIFENDITLKKINILNKYYNTLIKNKNIYNIYFYNLFLQNKKITYNFIEKNSLLRIILTLCKFYPKNKKYFDKLYCELYDKYVINELIKSSISQKYIIHNNICISGSIKLYECLIYVINKYHNSHWCLGYGLELICVNNNIELLEHICNKYNDKIIGNSNIYVIFNNLLNMDFINNSIYIYLIKKFNIDINIFPYSEKMKIIKDQINKSI